MKRGALVATRVSLKAPTGLLELSPGHCGQIPSLTPNNRVSSEELREEHHHTRHQNLSTTSGSHLPPPIRREPQKILENLTQRAAPSSVCLKPRPSVRPKGYSSHLRWDASRIRVGSTLSSRFPWSPGGLPRWKGTGCLLVNQP